jgi:hypothetical protein
MRIVVLLSVGVRGMQSVTHAALLFGWAVVHLAIVTAGALRRARSLSDGVHVHGQAHDAISMRTSSEPARAKSGNLPRYLAWK